MRAPHLLLVLLATPALGGCVGDAEGPGAGAAPPVTYVGETTLVLVRDAFDLDGPRDAEVRAYTGAACPNATWDGRRLTLMQGVAAPPPQGILLREFPQASLDDPRLMLETDRALLTGPATEIAFFGAHPQDVDVPSLFRQGPPLFRLRTGEDGVSLVQEGASVEGRNETRGDGLRPLRPGERVLANMTYPVPTDEGELQVDERAELVFLGRVPVHVVPPQGPCFEKDRCHLREEPTANQTWRARLQGEGEWVALLPVPVVPSRAEIFPGEHGGGTTIEDWLAHARVEAGEAHVSIERVANGSGLRIEGRDEVALSSSLVSGMRRATCTAETYLDAVWSIGEERHSDELPVRADATLRVTLGYEARSAWCGRHAAYEGTTTAPGWSRLAGTEGAECA